MNSAPFSAWRHGLTFALAGAALPLFLTPAWAIPAVTDLRAESVARIITNLEQQARKDPQDVQSRFNLARAHVLAYSLKTDTVWVRKGREAEGVWFGPLANHVPHRVTPTRDADKLKQAEQHLSNALERYQEVIKLAPNHMMARLGYAWVLDQSGDKAKAIASYRALIKDAWKKEKDLKNPPPGWHPVTTEAVAYLIPLLDPAKDHAELLSLRQLTKEVPLSWWRPRWVSPVVVPLRDGLRVEDLIDRSARVAFDADGTGLKKRWTWITRDAGWLVYDPRGSGQVTSALQMFGGVSFWLFWDNGYQALSALDDNGDGVLTGKELEGLAIWQDLNGNGVCDPGEVKPLAAWGIVAISCRPEQRGTPSGCAAFASTGVTFRGGQRRPTYDILLYPR